MRKIVLLITVLAVPVIFGSQALAVEIFKGPTLAPPGGNPPGIVYKTDDANFKANFLEGVDNNVISHGNSTVMKDLYLIDTKAIRADKATQSTLNMGNWGGPSNSNADFYLNVIGGLRVEKMPGLPVSLGHDGRVQAAKFCFEPNDCITSWPSAGPGPGIYVLKAGDAMSGQLTITSLGDKALQADALDVGHPYSTGVSGSGRYMGGYFSNPGTPGYGVVGLGGSSDGLVGGTIDTASAGGFFMGKRGVLGQGSSGMGGEFYVTDNPGSKVQLALSLPSPGSVGVSTTGDIIINAGSKLCFTNSCMSSAPPGPGTYVQKVGDSMTGRLDILTGGTGGAINVTSTGGGYTLQAAAPIAGGGSAGLFYSAGASAARNYVSLANNNVTDGTAIAASGTVRIFNNPGVTLPRATLDVGGTYTPYDVNTSVWVDRNMTVQGSGTNEQSYGANVKSRIVIGTDSVGQGPAIIAKNTAAATQPSNLRIGAFNGISATDKTGRVLVDGQMVVHGRVQPYLEGNYAIPRMGTTAAFWSYGNALIQGSETSYNASGVPSGGNWYKPVVRVGSYLGKPGIYAEPSTGENRNSDLILGASSNKIDIQGGVSSTMGIQALSGAITAPNFCIGTSCINAWPAGGGADPTKVLKTGDTMTGALTIGASAAKTLLVQNSLSGGFGGSFEAKTGTGIAVTGDGAYMGGSFQVWNPIGVGVLGAGGTADGNAGPANLYTRSVGGQFQGKNGVFGFGDSGGVGGEFFNNFNASSKVQLALDNGDSISTTGHVKVAAGKNLCLGADCRSAWPAGGGADTTKVLKTGDTMSGGLTISAGGLNVTGSSRFNSGLSIATGNFDVAGFTDLNGGARVMRSSYPKLAVGGTGSNINNTELWVEQEAAIQGAGTSFDGGRSRLILGNDPSFGMPRIYAGNTSYGSASALILGSSSNIVAINANTEVSGSLKLGGVSRGSWPKTTISILDTGYITTGCEAWNGWTTRTCPSGYTAIAINAHGCDSTTDSSGQCKYQFFTGDTFQAVPTTACGPYTYIRIQGTCIKIE